MNTEETLKHQLYGFGLTMAGAAMWGIAGVCSQYLLQIKQLPTLWVVAVRLSMASILFFPFAMSKPKYRNSMKAILTNRQSLKDMIIYSIFGLFIGQITYFVAIEYSNAATVTILQYTSPILILLYLTIRNRKLPKLLEIAAMIITITGVFLLVTHGSLHSLSISKLAFLWGMGTAITTVFYNLLPEKLMAEYDTVPVLTIAMIWCGIGMLIWVRPFSHITGIWDMQTVLVMLCIIFIGAFGAFYCYLSGLKIIGATKASIVMAVEPITSTILTCTVMHAIFYPIDLLGFVLILFGVFLLTISKS